MTKVYSRLECLTPKQERMLNDDVFFDVTKAEVTAFLNRLSRMKYSEETILRMRKKYDAYIHDRRKQLRIRCGLSIDEEYRVTMSSTKLGHYVVDGYSEELWMMLNKLDYIPDIRRLLPAISYLNAEGKNKETEFLKTKYKDMLEERGRRILRANGLPEDTPFNEIDKETIDGLTFFEWKLINLPEFTATKTHIRNTIRRFEKYGDHDKAIALYNKYADFLEDAEPEPELSIEEAMDVFQRFGINKREK